MPRPSWPSPVWGGIVWGCDADVVLVNARGCLCPQWVSSLRNRECRQSCSLRVPPLGDALGSYFGHLFLYIFQLCVSLRDDRINDNAVQYANGSLGRCASTHHIDCSFLWMCGSVLSHVERLWCRSIRSLCVILTWPLYHLWVVSTQTICKYRACMEFSLVPVLRVSRESQWIRKHPMIQLTWSLHEPMPQYQDRWPIIDRRQKTILSMNLFTFLELET